MNKFFNYYSSLCVGTSTPTTFSYDPYIAAIKDLLVSELQQIVYYIEKLKEFDVDMTEYTDKVIEFISVIIVNLDFQKESFFVIMKDLYNNKKMLEKMYISACEKKSQQPVLLKETDENYSSDEVILKTLNEREQRPQQNDFELTGEKKNLYQIIINLVLNSCNCLIELKNLDVNFEEAKNQVLKLLNTSNVPSLSTDEWKEKINDFSQCNYMIMNLLYKTIEEKFGPVFENNVEFCKKKGKAILVSGSSLIDLEKLLIAVKGLNINIYTHHEMISAFEYKKLNNYPNLTGHYQKSINNYPLDFASFPGPIYISRNSIPKIDVIRGQIYTSAKYPAYGIGKIENDDFSPLIKYALDAQGFEEDEIINTIKIGYSPENVDEKISSILEKLNNNEIKNIFIIGLIDRFSTDNEYINEFLEHCPEDNFVISFSYYKERENFWHVNSYYDFSIVYKIVEKLSSTLNDLSENVSIFLADCNSSTISHIFNLFYLGIKNIFLGPCCPNIINPVLIEGLLELYNIRSLTTAKEDIESIL